jgi:hypothetical protein
MTDDAAEQDAGLTSQIGPFAIVPLWLFERCRNARALQVYGFISARYANSANLAWPRLPVLAKGLGVTSRTIQDSIDILVAVGALKAERRKRSDGSLAGFQFEVIQVAPARVEVITTIADARRVEDADKRKKTSEMAAES